MEFGKNSPVIKTKISLDIRVDYERFMAILSAADYTKTVCFQEDRNTRIVIFSELLLCARLVLLFSGRVHQALSPPDVRPAMSLYVSKNACRRARSVRIYIRARDNAIPCDINSKIDFGILLWDETLSE